MENINFIPKLAVLVYECKENNSKEYYLESRRVVSTKLGHKMMEGTPMDEKTLAELSNCIKTREVDKVYSKGLLPKNVIYFGESNFKPFIIWTLPKGKRNLEFKKELNIENGTYNLPVLVFKLKNETLSVFAVKTNNVDDKTILYNAPFHNVYDNGNVCMGSAIIQKSNELSQIIKNYEKAFFMSKFSHHINSKSPIKKNLNTYLKTLKTKEFDNNVLIKSKVQLKELL